MSNEPVHQNTGHKVPTIAYFSSSPGGQYNLEKWAMWRGIAEATRNRGYHLVYVAGEEIETSPQATLYDLFDRENIDGLILWNSFISRQSLPEQLNDFISRYLPIPIVTIELKLEGCSSILVDNRHGMQNLLAHLINHHNYRKIAFIREKDTRASLEREKCFTDYLNQQGLFTAQLVGKLEDLDQRNLIPGIDYQAIVAHSDYEAALLVEKLNQRGVRLPEDVAITGFNDGQDARGCSPALTTIRLPFRMMGVQAVEILISQLNGEKSYSSFTAPTQLILRRSCGCLEPMAEEAATGRISARVSSRESPIINARNEIITELSQGMGTPTGSLAHTWAEQLFDIFFKELLHYQENPTLDSPSPGYVQDLSQILLHASAEGSNVSRWHEAVTILRNRILPYLESHELWFAEDLFQQARVLVGQSATRSEIHHSWQSARRAEILREMEAALFVALNDHELIQILVQGIKRLEINNFYLVLYENPSQPVGCRRLRLALKDGQEQEIVPKAESFPVRNILPEGYHNNNDVNSLVIEALHLGNEQIGYVVFKSPPPTDASKCDIYQAIRIQLSSALKGVSLRQELQLAVRQAEEANQLKSRFLSMVSHELRTPLNLIVGLSEMALRQQSHGKGIKGSRTLIELQKSYLEQIYISGQHLDRLIRDVLDLASSQVGQMNLVCEPLNLVPVLNDAASMCGQLANQKNLKFYTEIPDSLPWVWADKTRLRQVALNLLSNAIKFTAHGEVVLSAVHKESEIVISVRDTGLGIPKEEQDKIFDEFYQSDRSTTRGYGGIGLGLAITRRLIEMHGGRIWVDSGGAEGSGSNFSFTLPVIQKIETTEEKKHPSRADTVLILSNACESAEDLSRHLQNHGFKVDLLDLKRQHSFIEEIINYPPEAIVLDLPPASDVGWEIMKILKGNSETQDIPVLFYSLVDERNAGVVFELDYLSKPVDANELVNALKRYGLKNMDRQTGPKILIVDDDPGILNLQAQMIKEELPNCQISTARNGKEGLESMVDSKPDIVLLDLLMPELDGFGVLTAIQEDQNLRNIPVIVLTGQTLTEREMNRLRQGVSAVLEKGIFTSDEILARIENALSRKKRWMSESQHLVQRAMVFIHDHYKESLSRADIANYLCINEQYLSRCFKNEIGIGPMNYLSRYRIAQAKKLLERQDL
jgi:signal transduction histidine kinase/DNA-binding LacI/PurR family transcriptional regulator/DNA-binding response OmpR family regulator